MPKRAEGTAADLFDQHTIRGLQVYVERTEHGVGRVWLTLHLDGREKPVGIPIDTAWAERLMGDLGDALLTLARSAPAGSTTSH